VLTIVVTDQAAHQSHEDHKATDDGDRADGARWSAVVGGVAHGARIVSAVALAGARLRA
jgi:hypothetical protein